MNQSPRAQAQMGFEMIKDAALDVPRQRPSGETAAEIGKALGLHDSRRGGQNGYVVWTTLGHLIEERKVSYDEASRIYTIPR